MFCSRARSIHYATGHPTSRQGIRSHILYIPYTPACFPTWTNDNVGQTGSSCYTGKLLQLRFLKNWKTELCELCRIKKYLKPILHAKFGDDRRHLEKVMAQKIIFTSPSNFFTFWKIHLAPKKKNQKYPGTIGN